MTQPANIASLKLKKQSKTVFAKGEEGYAHREQTDECQGAMSKLIQTTINMLIGVIGKKLKPHKQKNLEKQHKPKKIPSMLTELWMD